MSTSQPQHLNLVLVEQPRKLDTRDLRLIGDLIGRMAPEIHVSIARMTTRAEEIPAAYWSRPTLTVSFGETGRFIPPRGPILANRPIAKLEQYQRMQSAGLRSPRTAEFRFGMRLDPAEWGGYVIVKPARLDLTSRGTGLFLFRAHRLAALTREDLPQGHLLRDVPMIVQRFIDTGEHFTVYRCLTLFGETLYQSIAQSPDAQQLGAATDAAIESLLPEPPRERTVVKISTDSEITDFARAMAAAFPRIPILGCDILRESATGHLYGLEVNAGGNVWHLSSPRTAPWRSHEGTMRLVRTFQPFEKAAEVLIGMTRKFAA